MVQLGKQFESESGREPSAETQLAAWQARVEQMNALASMTKE